VKFSFIVRRPCALLWLDGNIVEEDSTLLIVLSTKIDALFAAPTTVSVLRIAAILVTIRMDDLT